MPSRSAARHTSVGSPTGSAAATSNSRRVLPGSGASRRLKLSSIRPCSAGASGNPNPPANSAADNPRGNSNNANGLPRASATIRSRTRSSNGHHIAELSTARASSSPSPSISSSGNPGNGCASPVWRTPNTSPTDSANTRCATNSSACTDSWSNHCASSTMQRSGCSSAAWANKLSAASPTRKRSGAAPVVSPNAVLSASRWGPGRRSSRSSIVPQNWCNPAKASSISDCTPAARTTRQPDPRSTAYSSSAVLPTPGSPRTTRVRL